MSYELKKESNEKYCKTHKGVAAKIYTSIRRRSKLKGFEIPPYTLDEFKKWLEFTNFDNIYNSWVQSGYKKFEKPSVDRIDDSKQYVFDNMQVVKWSYNDDKGKKSKEKKIVCSNGNIYDSITKASIALNINRRSINNVLSGYSKTAGGFKWQYLQ